jgi:hypothetical protein
MASDTPEQRNYWYYALEECIKGVVVHQPDIHADPFYNFAPLQITFTTSDSSSVSAHDGNVILPEQTVEQPVVTYTPAPSTYYTLIMTDPDAPTRAKPSSREFIHWAVVNIPGNDINSGEQVCSYMGAVPPYNGGAHRYLFLLYQQLVPCPPENVAWACEYFNMRGGLRSSDFAAQLGMVAPVGFDGFVSQWSPWVETLNP